MEQNSNDGIADEILLQQIQNPISESLVLARIALQTKQYQDAVDFCQPLLALESRDLNKDERLMLVDSHKGEILQLRIVVREIINNPLKSQFLTGQMKNAQDKIVVKCRKFIDQVQKNLLPKSSCIESFTFYLNIIADFQRYCLESLNEKEKQQFKDQILTAMKSYENLLSESQKLHIVHPTRIKSILSYSKFLKYIMNQPSQALQKLQECHHQAISIIYTKEGQKSLSEDQQKDSAQLLHKINLLIFVWDDEINGATNSIFSTANSFSDEKINNMRSRTKNKSFQKRQKNLDFTSEQF